MLLRQTGTRLGRALMPQVPNGIPLMPRQRIRAGILQTYRQRGQTLRIYTTFTAINIKHPPRLTHSRFQEQFQEQARLQLRRMPRDRS